MVTKGDYPMATKKIDSTPARSLEDELTGIAINLEHAMAMIEAVTTAMDPRHVDSGHVLARESAADVLAEVRLLLSESVREPVNRLVKEEIEHAAGATAVTQ
jgi:hypothetical protein